MGRDDVPLGHFVRPRWEFWELWNSWRGVVQEIAEVNKKFEWDKKENRCFFGGHVFSRDHSRIRYFEHCVRSPQLFAGSITGVPGLLKPEQESVMRHLIDKWLPMERLPSYRYLMHLDGNSSSDRLRYLLAFNSVVLKSMSPFYEFYFPLLEPDRHYVLVREDLQDLPATIERLNGDDKFCRYISSEGQRFVQEVLTYDNVLWYVKEALVRYRELCR
jgi:hypothetical protein